MSKELQTVVNVGQCECGCGQTTGIYKTSHPDRGIIKGMPMESSKKENVNE